MLCAKAHFISIPELRKIVWLRSRRPIYIRSDDAAQDLLLVNYEGWRFERHQSGHFQRSRPSRLGGISPRRTSPVVAAGELVRQRHYFLHAH